MTKFIHLSSDILLRLLNHNFSLEQLFHLRQLCSRMQSLIESRHCIGTRKCLKLFWCFKGVRTYTDFVYTWKLENDSALLLKNGRFDDDLILCGTRFTRFTVDWLGRMFPSVTHLLIFFTNWEKTVQPYHTQLGYLISRWTLTRFSLFGNFGIDEETVREPIVRALCDQINLLSNLKQLDLDTQLAVLQIDSKVMFQLERLCLIIRVSTSAEQVLRMLEHAQSGHSKPTELFIYFPNAQMDLFDKLCRFRGLTIAHLTITSLVGEWQDYSNVLDRICMSRDHLSGSLRSLCLEQKPNYDTMDQLMYLGRMAPMISVVKVLDKLIKLTHLEELALRGFLLSPLWDNNQEQQVPMRTVTRLTIQDDSLPRSQLKSLTSSLFFPSIRRIFPSVRSFTLQLDSASSVPFTKSIDPIDELLSSFESLTRFELTIYPEMANHTVVHLLSEKHRKRFESTRKRVCNRIGQNGGGGRQRWIRKSTTVQQRNNEDMKKEDRSRIVENKNRTVDVWTKDIVRDPVVYGQAARFGNVVIHFG